MLQPIKVVPQKVKLNNSNHLGESPLPIGALAKQLFMPQDSLLMALSRHVCHSFSHVPKVPIVLKVPFVPKTPKSGPLPLPLRTLNRKGRGSQGEI